MPLEKGRSWFYDVLFWEVKPHLSDTMSVWYVRDWIICIPLPVSCSAEPEGISVWLYGLPFLHCTYTGITKKWTKGIWGQPFSNCSDRDRPNRKHMLFPPCLTNLAFRVQFPRRGAGPVQAGTGVRGFPRYSLGEKNIRNDFQRRSSCTISQ